MFAYSDPPDPINGEKERKMKNWLIKSMWVAGIIIGAICSASSVSAGEPAADDGWKFAAEFYLWGAAVSATSALGSDVGAKLDDILEARRLAYMGAVGVNKGRWTLAADMTYLKVDGSSEIAPSLNASAKVTSWIITPLVGYNLVDTQKGRLDLLGGARYLSVKAELGVDELNVRRDGSESNLDAIIGARGNLNVAENWFLFGLLDVGTGESDLTWQALGGVGYRFKWFNLVAAYRYISWDFGEDTEVIDNLKVHGPAIGIQYIF